MKDVVNDCKNCHYGLLQDNVWPCGACHVTDEEVFTRWCPENKHFKKAQQEG